MAVDPMARPPQFQREDDFVPTVAALKSHLKSARRRPRPICWRGFATGSTTPASGSTAESAGDALRSTTSTTGWWPSLSAAPPGRASSPRVRTGVRMSEETSVERILRERREENQADNERQARIGEFLVANIDNARPRVEQPFLDAVRKAIAEPEKITLAPAPPSAMRTLTFEAFDRQNNARVEAKIIITGKGPVKNPDEIRYDLHLSARVSIGGRYLDVFIDPDEGIREQRPFASRDRIVFEIEDAIKTLLIGGGRPLYP